MRRSGALIAMLVGCRFEPGVLPGARDDAALIDARVIDASLTDGTIVDGSQPTDAAIDAAVAKACPPSYTLLDNARPNSRYRSVTASIDWAQAEMICEADGGGTFKPAHLIVLDSKEEEVWAYAQNNSAQWVGVTDVGDEGVLLAVTTQANPYFGNATGNMMSLDCLILNANETTLEGCGAGHPYLCECDGLAADPTRF